jgi:predicted RNA-binding protein YlxR (DUF448 family)
MSAQRQPHIRHVPLRTCVICREKSDKRSLTRVVRTEQGLQIDPSGKLNGRGAYLCDQMTCWERAVQTDVLSKALRTTLTVQDREYLRRARPES